ncbi:MAG: four helix bundle protein [Candidatus Omnitrophica bacterium]|nr:four helix bundle protein [Candidatus Omnitrophota bacterium]
MAQAENKTAYDLEERTLKFAKNVRVFINKIPKTLANNEDGKQLLRSSGSIGANYIEANESLGKKDLVMKLKISKKEAKESKYWLSLINLGEINELRKEQQMLYQESHELMCIFGAIIKKCG